MCICMCAFVCVYMQMYVYLHSSICSSTNTSTTSTRSCSPLIVTAVDPLSSLFSFPHSFSLSRSQFATVSPEC